MNIRLWILVGLLVFGLVGLDRMLWEESSLKNRVGQNEESLIAPLDSLMVDAVGPILQREKLEEQLARTDAPKEYGRLSQELYKHLGKMGKTKEQANLMLQTAEKFPGVKDGNILEAHKLAAAYCVETGDSTSLLKLLEIMLGYISDRKLGEGLLETITCLATQGDSASFIEKHLYPLLADKNLKPDTRYGVISGLYSYYKKKGDAGNEEKLKKMLLASGKTVNMKKLVTNATKQVNMLVRQSKFDQAMELAEINIELHPEHAAVFCKQYIGVGKAYLKKNDLDGVLKAWRRLDLHGTKVSEKINSWDTHLFIRHTIVALLKENRHSDLTFVVNAASKLSKAYARQYAKFLAVQEWLQSGKKGQPPRPLYVVKHINESDIEVDGKLDEPIYSRLPPMPQPFWFSYNADSGYLRKADILKLRAYAFYSDKAIYVSIHAPEPTPEYIKRESRPGLTGGCWKDDCIEFFIDIDCKAQFATQWIFTPGEAFSWGRPGVTKEEIAALPSIFCKAAIGEDAYVIEARIPLEQLPDGGKALSGKTVMGNLRRIRWLHENMKTEDKLKKSKNAAISWADIEGDSQSVTQMNLLQFE